MTCKIVPIEDKYLIAEGINPEECFYRSVEYGMDVKGYNRVHAVINNGCNPNILKDYNVVLQIIDPRPHVGILCYAIFPKESVSSLIKICKKKENKFWFDVYKALPISPIFMSKHSKFSVEIVIKKLQHLNKFTLTNKSYVKIDTEA